MCLVIGQSDICSPKGNTEVLQISTHSSALPRRSFGILTSNCNCSQVLTYREDIVDLVNPSFTPKADPMLRIAPHAFLSVQVIVHAQKPASFLIQEEFGGLLLGSHWYRSRWAELTEPATSHVRPKMSAHIACRLKSTFWESAMPAHGPPTPPVAVGLRFCPR